VYRGSISVQVELYSKLIQLRNSLASQLGLHTYMVFSNKSLLDMSQCRLSSATVDLIAVDVHRIYYVLPALV